MIFDIGEGDSFSDIYGIPRLLNQTITKILAKWKVGNLYLAPQTYGPFKTFFGKRLAKIVANQADEIFSRDELSKNHYQSLISKKINNFTDVAFSLPFTKMPLNEDTTKVGINVSGLLYSRPPNDGNFALKLNYADYTDRVIEYFVNQGVEVTLVPHVSGKANEEDDLYASKLLLSKFKQLKIAPKFSTPVEAKTFISQFDFFIGARMHATIAAFSSNVAVAPVAYSMKFKGVFSAVNYQYILDGAELSADEALANTIEYFSQREVLKNAAIEGNLIAKAKLKEYTDILNRIFNDKFLK
jgi:polysaccharide pyruvyl transferase WcaK-like protein